MDPILLDSTPDMADWMVSIHDGCVCVISPPAAGADGHFARTPDGRYAVDVEHVPAIDAALRAAERYSPGTVTDDAGPQVAVARDGDRVVFDVDPYPYHCPPQTRALEFPLAAVPGLRAQLAAIRA